MNKQLEMRRCKRSNTQVIQSIRRLEELQQLQQQQSLWLFGIAAAGLGVIASGWRDFGPLIGQQLAVFWVLRATAGLFLASAAFGAAYYQESNAVLGILRSEQDALSVIHDIDMARLEGSTTNSDTPETYGEWQRKAKNDESKRSAGIAMAAWLLTFQRWLLVVAGIGIWILIWNIPTLGQ